MSYNFDMRYCSHCKSYAVLLIALLAIGLLGGCQKDAKVSGKAAISKGWDYFQLGEYDSAINAFEQAEVTSGNDSDLKAEAWYGLATVWNLRRPDENVAKAKEYYDKIIKSFPQNELAAWSMLAKARMIHLMPAGQQIDRPAVLSAYKKVYAKYGNTLAGQESFIHYQAVLISSLDADDVKQAITNCRDFIAKQPDSPFVSAAYLLIAKSYEILQDPSGQMESLIAALNSSRGGTESSGLNNVYNYWHIATLAEFKVGNFDLARKYYKKIIDEYPVDVRNYSCDQAIKRMNEMESKFQKESVKLEKSNAAKS